MRVVIGLLFLAVLGVPFLLRPASSPGSSKHDTPSLIILTPHVQQIQYEFGRAFTAWHLRVHGEEVRVDWRTPGGTSEILRQLEAQFSAAAKSGHVDFTDPANPIVSPGSIAVDLVMGGGSYDHGRLKKGVTITLDTGIEHRLPMSVPAGFDQSQLDAWFGENRVGSQNLYDPEQYWIGTALSSFGIVFNRELFAELGIDEPRSFESLTDPRLAGWLVLSDPRQSGSVTTSFDSILSNYGWDRGWRTLRLMCANARSFTERSSKPPVDVAMGEAAAGLAIDFYGRGQEQAIEESTGSRRVGYIDPPGETMMDADPISMLRGGPNPELARRFIDFVLSDDGQALWQFHPGASASEGVPAGPERYALRRSSVRRAMYAGFRDHMTDPQDPFEVATKTKPAGWRDAILPIIGASGIDTATDLIPAWKALREARADSSFPTDTLEAMEQEFFSFPMHPMPDGSTLEFTPESIPAIKASWKDPTHRARSEIAYTKHYRDAYRNVVRLFSDATRAH